MRLVLIALVIVNLMQISAISAQSGAGDKYVIYLAVWRGCEDACQGFKDYVSEIGMKAEVIVRNANREKSKLAGFVEEARAMDADLVITWGTTVTLAMAGTTADRNDPKFIQNIPLVFMIVADPVGAKIIDSYSASGRKNITGTRNRVPEAVNIKAIRTYRKAFRHIGMLYNKDERNSVLKMEELKILAPKMNLLFTAYELKLSNDAGPSVDGFASGLAALKNQGVDFVYMGSSSFLRKNGDAFTAAAIEAGLPVFSPYEHLVRNSQALMSVAAHYYDVGQLVGEQVKAILLDKKSPGQLPIRAVANYAYVINMATARKLNMYPSVDILQFAEIVNK
jgi:putative ABC transport system substrate-binding protein